MATIVEVPSKPRYSVVSPVVHHLHECASADDFASSFELATGRTVHSIVDELIDHAIPKAVFLTGSIPLGMATNGSDVDFVVLLDSRDAVRGSTVRRNTDQQLSFSNEGDSLRAGLSITVIEGITVEVATVLTPGIKQVYARLRSKGPELSGSEIMMLGRLSSGWLLSQTENYLQARGLNLRDPSLNIYCCTRDLTFSRIYGMKAGRALDLDDVPQALHLGRLGVEMAYLAYFASEGFPYLGAKWLAQLGHARGAAARLAGYPLLKEGIPLLFPEYATDPQRVKSYLTDARALAESIKGLIARKTLFKIALQACPQI